MDDQPRHAYPDDHWLLYKCPWCQAAEFHRCAIPGGREWRKQPHTARLELVGTAIAQDAGAR